MHKSIFIWLFTIYCSVILAQEDHGSVTVELTEGLPCNIINQTVSVISGEYVENHVDILLPGPRPLSFCRTYSSFVGDKGLGKGWSYNHDGYVYEQEYKSDKKTMVRHTLSLPHGSKFEFKRNKKKTNEKSVLQKPKGFTVIPSRSGARSHIKNTSFKSEKNQLVTRSGDGTLRKYNKYKKSFIFNLDSDQNVRGQSHCYKSEHGWWSIENKSVYSGNTYAVLLRQNNSKFTNNLTDKYLTPEGREFSYEYIKNDYSEMILPSRVDDDGVYLDPLYNEKTDYYLKAAHYKHAPSITYEYSKKSSNPDLWHIKARRCHDHYLKTEYYHNKSNDLGILGKRKLNLSDFRIDRVKRQFAPVGTDATPVQIFTFDYHKDSTDVYDAHLHKTNYTYDSSHRIKKIHRFLGALPNAYEPYSFERFVWGSAKDNQEEYVLYKYFVDFKTHIIHHGFQFAYDDVGNTVAKILFGKLTGYPLPQVVMDTKHRPVGDYERETTLYTYSSDGLNLLLSETNSDGKSIHYRYYPGTDALQAKFIKCHDRICLREFYTYDRDFVLIKKIADDGIDENEANLHLVTHRHITNYLPRAASPFGLYTLIDEMYYDFGLGREILLKRVENEYSAEGYLLRQVTYDANGIYAYEMKWEYNNHGKVTKEINPLGEEIRRVYDCNDNLSEEYGPHPDYMAKNFYDCSNRLVKREEVHQGVTFTETTHTTS